MSSHILLPILISLSSVYVNAQTGTTSSLQPLASRSYSFNDLPYQVCGDECGPRGPQLGFNVCNSTTQNQQSLCQTAIFNNIGDFCMWSSSQTQDTISESEQREIAWCSQPGHGSRVIPPGAITGLQWLYAKSYVQLVGFLDQTTVGLQASDSGGELDPFGDDGQGNPLGGEFFSNALPLGSQSNAAAFDSFLSSSHGINASTANLNQVTYWVDFIGNGQFCMKACQTSNPLAPLTCNHIYDEIGCNYNAPADYAAINGTFTVCDSDDMTPPGQYTVDGTSTTWTQPFTGAVNPPYTPTIPASSNCHTYSSEQLFASVQSFSAFSTSSSSSAKPTGSGASASGSGSRSGSSAAVSQTGNNSGAVGSFEASRALPFVTAGFATVVITVVALLV